MSQAMLIRLRALEDRVADLESTVSEMEGPSEQETEVEGPFKPKHKGFNRYLVVGRDGTPVGTQSMTRTEALAQAAELNEALEGVAA